MDNRFYFSRIFYEPKTQKMNTITPDSSDNSGLIIGFSGTYYCLWSWWNEANYSMTGSGNYVATDGYTKYAYIKRISTDLNKVKELYPNIPIDMGLHGQSWDLDKKGKKESLPYDVFPYGFKGEGTKIMECNEPKHLWALYLKNYRGTARNKVYARRRLVELGLLVPYKTSKNIEVWKQKFVNDVCVDYSETIVTRSSYSSPSFVAKVEASKEKAEAYKLMEKGHFYNDGDKVVLKVKKIGSFSFESKFGTCFVVEYVDSENRVFKYKGSTPPYFENENIFTEVKATIKHGNYKGQDETLIQRISII